jgi:ribosomal protein S17E
MKWFSALAMVAFSAALSSQTSVAADNADKVIAACKKSFDANKADCSAFVRAVAKEVHIKVAGNANQIVASMESSGGPWTKLADGADAAKKAGDGWLVVGGLQGQKHTPPEANGHVVIVVRGPLKEDKYPIAYWGRLHGVGEQAQFVTKAWKKVDLPKVEYFTRPLP